MRCVASSPAAAVQALRNQARLPDPADADADDAKELLRDRVLDGSADLLPEDDVEPPAATGDATLATLIQQAEQLVGQAGDPKLKLLTEHLGQLLAEGFSPVVFCRYLATAHYPQVAHPPRST